MAAKHDGKRAAANMWVTYQNLARAKGGRPQYQQPVKKGKKSPPQPKEAEEKAEAKAETKAEVNAETKAEVNADAKGDAKGDAKADAKADVKSGATSAGKKKARVEKSAKP